MTAFGESRSVSDISVTKQGFCLSRSMIRLRFRFPRISKRRATSRVSYMIYIMLVLTAYNSRVGWNCLCLLKKTSGLIVTEYHSPSFSPRLRLPLYSLFQFRYKSLQEIAVRWCHIDQVLTQNHKTSYWFAMSNRMGIIQSDGSIAGLRTVK